LRGVPLSIGTRTETKADPIAGWPGVRCNGRCPGAWVFHLRLRTVSIWLRVLPSVSDVTRGAQSAEFESFLEIVLHTPLGSTSTRGTGVHVRAGRPWPRGSREVPNDVQSRDVVPEVNGVF
jgi:hypothetical protein